MKIRGITLSAATRGMLPYATFKALLMEYCGKGEAVVPVVVENSHFITVKKGGRIVSRRMRKKYRIVVSKGVVDDDYNVLPFGWNPNPK